MGKNRNLLLAFSGLALAVTIAAAALSPKGRHEQEDQIPIQSYQQAAPRYAPPVFRHMDADRIRRCSPEQAEELEREFQRRSEGFTFSSSNCHYIPYGYQTCNPEFDQNLLDFMESLGTPYLYSFEIPTSVPATYITIDTRVGCHSISGADSQFREDYPGCEATTITGPTHYCTEKYGCDTRNGKLVFTNCPRSFGEYTEDR